MISEYIAFFGWKWIAFMIIILVVFIPFLWKFKTWYSARLSEEKKLKLFGALIIWWGIVMIFIFTIVTFVIYHQDLNSYKKIIAVIVWPYLSILMTGSWLFSIYFKKRINSVSFTDSGMQLLIYGILLFIAFVFYYLKWIA